MQMWRVYGTFQLFWVFCLSIKFARLLLEESRLPNSVIHVWPNWISNKAILLFLCDIIRKCNVLLRSKLPWNKFTFPVASLKVFLPCGFTVKDLLSWDNYRSLKRQYQQLKLSQSSVSQLSITRSRSSSQATDIS